MHRSWRKTYAEIIEPISKPCRSLGEEAQVNAMLATANERQRQGASSCARHLRLQPAPARTEVLANGNAPGTTGERYFKSRSSECLVTRLLAVGRVAGVFSWLGCLPVVPEGGGGAVIQRGIFPRPSPVRAGFGRGLHRASRKIPPDRVGMTERKFMAQTLPGSVHKSGGRETIQFGKRFLARRRKRPPGRARSPAKSQPGGQWQFGVDERGKGRLNVLNYGERKYGNFY